MESNNMMDKYIKGKQLGEGNYGITYLCTEITTSKQYACKCIQKSTLLSQKQRKNVQREISILRLISFNEQPNIVSVKEVLEDDHQINIVMELCEGGTVHEYMIENDMAFEEPRAATMMKEIACAIEACHNLGIVHRDLKLENMLFQTKDVDSPLKVIDFGFAQFFENGEFLIDIIGSSSYIAPEVVEGHHGPKVDIWSAGVILYTLLSGFFPFIADTLVETYKEVMKGSHDLFDEDPWPTISEGAKDLVRKMLTRNVNERLTPSEVLKHPWILENAK